MKLEELDFEKIEVEEIPKSMQDMFREFLDPIHAATSIKEGAEGTFKVTIEDAGDEKNVSIDVEGTTGGAAYAAYFLLRDAVRETGKDIDLLLKAMKVMYMNDSEENDEEES